MPGKFTLLFVFICSAMIVQGQKAGLKGILQDANDKTPLKGATVMLFSGNDSLPGWTAVSTERGLFDFKNLSAGNYKVRISSIGYEDQERSSILKDSIIDLGTILMPKEAKLLSEVIVQATTPPVKQKDDTLEYSANAFKVNPDATAENMIKKMPGITIENGVVKSGGDEVKKVTIDGRDFFGDDASAALKNMPAEVIDKIQVFDRLSDQARFTGFEDANTTKAINIVTKANMRNGQFGRLYAGYGTDDRYSAGGNVSFFNGNRRISLVGLTNNVNQQNFGSEDLLGLTSSQSRGGGRGGGGGGGGRPGGGGGNAGNFIVGQQGGISKTNAFGINFSDVWGKKATVSGSYFFNNSNNTSKDLLNRETFMKGDSSTFYNENSNAFTKNTNHRINLRVEYKFDSSNTLLITPTISFQENHSLSDITGISSLKDKTLVSQVVNSNIQNTSGYNINNGILFRHAFSKRGRTISLNLNTGINNRVGENYINGVNTYYVTGQDDSLQQFKDQNSKGYQVSANIAYTEPVGKKGQVQLNYNPSWSKSNSDQETFQFDDPVGKYTFFDSTLSNKYDNIYTTQNGGLTYRFGDRENMFSAGIAYQQANLSGDQTFPLASVIDRNFSNFLPNLMLRKKLSAKSNIRIFYRTNTSAPSVTQLQDVIDNSNSLFLRTGNPDLKQQYSHNLVGRYTYTNSSKGQSFLANLSVQKTNDYVGSSTITATEDSVISSTITLHKGSQLIKPINLDGYWNVRSFLTFGMPLKFIKSNLNWNAGFSYIKTPGFINDSTNLSKAQNYNIGAVLASNISEYVDFTLSYTANFNQVKNSIQQKMDNYYFTQVAGISIDLLSKNGWTFENSLNNQSYRGLTEGFNQNFWLWNMSVGKKFLKDQKGELRLSVFDLLKQNQSITRTVTDANIEDLQTQVLQQYFMLTFSYRLRNFGSKKINQGQEERRMR